MIAFIVVAAFLLAPVAAAAEDGVLVSRRAAREFSLTADPGRGPWKHAEGVVTSTGRYGEAVPNGRTEIRSVWTPTQLSFLFISNYDTLYLKPNPAPAKETWGLWDFDVVEVFIGHDLQNINRYLEFEFSPQSEFIDLDVDRDRKGKEVDWLWNSGVKYRTRIDRQRKVWYCEMQIPWSAIAPKPPESRQEFRLNLYRIEGGEPNRKYIAWRPVNSPSYHTPEAFGRLRLAPR